MAKAEKIKSLQGLRVLAFLGIFLSHAIDTPTGSWGVSVFIMLSGFIMVYSYWNRETLPSPTIRNAAAFSIRKIRPLYPLHLIMLIAAFIPYYLLPVIRDFSSREFVKIAAKLVITVPLIQAWFPVGFEAINTVAWYLSAMLFLYAVFPWILKFLKKDDGIRKNVIRMALAYLLQFAAAFVFRFLPLLKNAHWSCYILPVFRLGDFFIGCCLGYCFLKTRKSDPDTAVSVRATVLEVAALAAAAASMILSPRLENAKWFSFTLLYVPSSAAIVYVFAGSRGAVSRLLSIRPLQWLAMLSPFAFLIHRQVLHYIEDGYRLAAGTGIDPVLLIASAMLVTLALSWLYMRITARRKGAKSAQ